MGCSSATRAPRIFASTRCILFQIFGQPKKLCEKTLQISSTVSRVDQKFEIEFPENFLFD